MVFKRFNPHSRIHKNTRRWKRRRRRRLSWLGWRRAREKRAGSHELQRVRAGILWHRSDEQSLSLWHK